MTKGRGITRRWSANESKRLEKLFRALGTDNEHEFDVARAAIDRLLRQFDKDWSDLGELLGGRPADISADLARDIVALGSSDPEERAKARRNIADLLARHRKNWNDLADVLCSASTAAWASNPSADDPPRVNPLSLVHYLLRGVRRAEAARIYRGRAVDSAHPCLRPVSWLHRVWPSAARSLIVARRRCSMFCRELTAQPSKFDAITTAAIFPPDRWPTSDAADRRSR